DQDRDVASAAVLRPERERGGSDRQESRQQRRALHVPPPYALRSATIGSTVVARRAGTRHATAATRPSISATARNVGGSVGETSYRRLAQSRETASATATPIARPIPTWRMPCPSTIARTLSGRAPSAMRMPNSCRRCPTENAITPAMPVAVIV